MKTRVAVALMAVLLALYLVFAAQYGIRLIGIGDAVPVAIGVALLVLPAIATWALVVELVFTVRAERLGTRLEREGGLPPDELPTRASGRVDRSAAEAVFPTYRAQVEAAPEDWRAWYRLGLAYDAAGDRRRARWAIRQAVRLAQREH